MNHSWFRFYAELNDFLPSEKQKKLFKYQFHGSPSVKDAIEAIGIPHAEVDLILINSTPSAFSDRINNGDIISVYPVFESFDITSVQHLRAKPLRITKFINDVHLGTLTKYLRLCGFDTFYKKDLNDIEIINLSVSEDRIILTRDLELLKNSIVTHGYWIRSQNTHEQLKEVFRRFDLASQMSPFIRCMECNGMLSDVSKKEIQDRLLPETIRIFAKFRMCSQCSRVYWEGSHFERMKKYIDKLIKDVN